MSDVLDGIRHKARDNARMPIPWTDEPPHAGFTTAHKPWMKVNEDFGEWNVERQVGEEGSVWMFWKRALEFRKANKACVRLSSLFLVDTKLNLHADLWSLRAGRQGEL